jgi:hypothetical protein
MSVEQFVKRRSGEIAKVEDDTIEFKTMRQWKLCLFLSHIQMPATIGIGFDPPTSPLETTMSLQAAR